jgi:hypothetical protein
MLELIIGILKMFVLKARKKMTQFLYSLRLRNEPLFWFGLICFALAGLFLILTRFSNGQVMGINAWVKPMKFALSLAIYAWTMAWFCHDLMPNFNPRPFNQTVIGLLGFELAYIVWQAGRGQLSHFNLSSPVYAGLYSAMAIAITIVVLYTAYVGILFFSRDFPDLPNYYVWSVRIGIVLFVIFSLEGFAMGSRLAHTVGGSDGGPGLPVVNWSTRYGDLRIAHFIGMHALQVLPLLSFYLLKDVRLTVFVGIVYAALAAFTLWQALGGKPLLRIFY